MAAQKLYSLNLCSMRHLSSKSYKYYKSFLLPSQSIGLKQMRFVRWRLGIQIGANLFHMTFQRPNSRLVESSGYLLNRADQQLISRLGLRRIDGVSREFQHA